MDTLLKETVDATVNSRYPGMAPEGRKLIEDILIRKELEKGELLFKEGQRYKRFDLYQILLSD